MRIEYDAALIERTVFLIAHDDPDIERELHAPSDPLYAMPPSRQRDAAFHQVYARLFVRLGIQKVIDTVLAERPCIAASIARCIVRDAVRPSAQSAELFVRSDAGQRQESNIIIQ